MNNRSVGFAIRYGVKIPQNRSVTFVDADVDGQQTNGEAGGSGYWFEEKQFVGPTFETVNFWVCATFADFPARRRTKTETENETETEC